MEKIIVITGGHLSPAISVIQKLKKRNWKIFFLGRKYAFSKDKELSFEYTEMQKMGINFIDPQSVRLKKEISFLNLYSLFYFPFRIIKLLPVLKRIRPDFILSFGGYVGFPVCIAGLILRIPLLLHEQTLKPGRTNMLLSRFAWKIFVSWKENLKYFPAGKTLLTGNPLREEIKKIPEKEEPKGLSIQKKEALLYITGGSTGAHEINKRIAKLLPFLLRKFQVIHQCGVSYYDDCSSLNKIREDLPQKLKSKYAIYKNLEAVRLNRVLNAADIIIGRSGANTVCELSVLGKIAIFIPHPLSAFDEQRANAKKMADNGTAIILEEEKLNWGNLKEILNKIILNIDELNKKAFDFSQSAETENHKVAASKIGLFFDNCFAN